MGIYTKTIRKHRIPTHNNDKTVIKGQLYKVPCIKRWYVETVIEEVDDSLCRGFMDRTEKHKKYYIPIYNHPHSDIENGQTEIHYHRDTRFEEVDKPDSEYNNNGSIVLQKDDTIVIKELTAVADSEKWYTPAEMISKSKLKHRCIHKGKCPHRGYDLSGIEPADGVIRCPLHGLRFDSNTKQLIEYGR